MKFNLLHWPRNQESLDLWQQVHALAMEGLTAREIAERLDIKPSVVSQRIAHFVRHGLLPYANERKAARRKEAWSTVRRLCYEHGKVHGSMSQVVDCLSIEQAEWLFNNTPKGATVAEFVASIIVDAYEEEQDGN